DLFRIHLNTFRSVFPHATFWYVPGSDQAFLLATPEPFVLDADRVRPRIDALAGWFRAAEYQLDTVERIAGFFWMDESAMGRLIGDETRVNTDDLHYFDKQSAVYPAPPQAQLPRFQADAAPHVTGADEATLRQIRTEQNVAAHLARYGFYGSRADLDRAYCLDPDNGNARWFLSLALGGGLPDPDGFCGDAEIRRYRALVDTHPDNALALNALADLLQEAGNLEEARILVERAVSLEPDSGMILDTYGWVLHRSGHPEAALDVLTDAAGRLPDHPIVQYHLGAVKAALGRGDEAAHHLTRALADPRGFPSSDEARNLLESLGR
ncbi:MAG TPA: tetratricopeptide repeat protein, partial [bacterium]|nr:tetratricopeptide repeat protein [bacterium]